MKYFTKEELTCSHCGASDIDAPFMEKVESLREELGFPFPVNSAYRCRGRYKVWRVWWDWYKPKR